MHHATECEADAISDGTNCYVPAVMEHIELAGIHSGDSACILPSLNLTDEQVATIKEYTRNLKPGCSIGYHKHEGTCEIIFIVSGKGKLIQDDEEFEVSPEQCLYCPEGHSHSLINNGTEDLVFFAAVPKQ